MAIEQSASDDSKENQGGVSSSEAVLSTSKLGKSNDVEPVTANSEESGDKAEWPLNNIKEPHKNDVLYGRGGGTNHHPGNKRYRIMVECRKIDYVSSKRLDKPLVALEIIREWRAQEPPGRFLKMDEHTGLWNDVGDKKAREKTSQALREKAPSLRKQQQGDVAYPVNEGASVKYTRFDVPPGKKNMAHPLTLQRDHSLGRDILESSEKVALGNNFSWGSGFFENEPVSDYHKYGTEKIESNWTAHPADIVQKSPPIEYYDDMTSPSRIQRHSHPHDLNPAYNNQMSHHVPNGMYVSKSHPVTPVRSSHPSGEFDWPAQPIGNVSRSEDGSPTRWAPGEYTKPISHTQIRHESPESESGRHADERDNDAPEGVGHLFSRVADMLQEPENDWRGQDRGSVQGNSAFPDRYHHGEIPVEYDKWTSPSRVNRPPSDGGKHTPRRSNTYEARGINLTKSLSGSDDTNYPAQGTSGKRPDDHFSTDFRPQFINTDVNAGDPVVTPTTSSNSRSSHRRRVRQSNSRNHERNSPHRLKSPPPKFEIGHNISNSPSNRIDKSSIPKPSPVKRDTSNQCETSETKHCVKRMNRQRSIGHRNLDRVSEKEVTSVMNSLQQSSLEHNVRTNGKLDEPKKVDIKALERPAKIENSGRARTYDSFDFAIDDTIGKTDNLEDDSAPNVDVVSWSEVEEKDSTKWKPASFTFPESESSESNLSLPQNFLNNSDRMSSLGSVEGTDVEDLVKANC